MTSKTKSADLDTSNGMPSYQCVLMADDQWHLTQEQATPPLLTAGGAWTTCGSWAEFKRGFEKRRPTCNVCMAAVLVYESRAALVRNPAT